MSYPGCQTVIMKLNLLAHWKQDQGELIASFGDARLLKKLSGKIELVGGTADDRAEAKEWASLFLHEARV